VLGGRSSSFRQRTTELSWPPCRAAEPAW